MLCTLFPLLDYLDDQCGESLESSLANHGFGDFPDLIIKYYTSIRNGTLLNEKYTTIENHTLLKDVRNLMYLTQLNFLEETPNQILHILSTLILWSKTFYTTICQEPTLYNFLAIT